MNLRRGALWVLAAASYAAACLSKENGILALTLPLVADLVPGPTPDSRRPRLSRHLVGYARYAGVAVAYLVIREQIVGSPLRGAVAFLDNPLASQSIGIRSVLALGLLGRYAALLAWPASLSADYSYNAITLSVRDALPFVAAGLAVVAGGAVAFVRACTRHRAAAVGLSFAAATWGLTSNLILKTEVMFAERLAYLPLVGLALAAADALALLGRPPVM